MLNEMSFPLLSVLQSLSTKEHSAFYAPGHKQGRGINKELVNLFGKDVFQADLPELPELDNLFAPEGVILEAQKLAATTFGAEKTWFLINGSTCGIIAAILATCGTGDKIILPRNIHQSAIAGLILSGAIPIFINPEYDSKEGLVYSITSEAVKQTLLQHPDAKAVMILYPTYQGVCGDIEVIAKITNEYNIPLLVDEAHGAHFAFHPNLPPSALSAGADLTVQSTHKVLGAMTQASMLHIQGKRVSDRAVNKALQLVQSTSPSYLLLASLDAARQQMALAGKGLMTQTLQLADTARKQITEIKGLSVLDNVVQSGLTYLDLTRLTINISQLGITGYEADEILHQQLKVTCELPLPQHLTFIISFGNTPQDIKNLINALTKLTETSPLMPSASYFIPHPSSLIPHTSSLSPRQAYFSPTETIAIEVSCDRFCAELICPYPPGIPILMPGERITTEAINYLKQVLNSGGTITGASDSNLKTIEVIRS